MTELKNKAKYVPIGRKNASDGRKFFKSIYHGAKNINYKFVMMIGPGEKLFEFSSGEDVLYIAFGENFITTYNENLEMFGGERDEL